MNDYDTLDDATTQCGEQPLLAGRFRVVKRLGDGGMGSVWLAEDQQLDGKKVAVKMLPSVLASNQRAIRQLKDEALVAMKLTHPNIVTLRAFEENNGNPFLVMDYVDGQTLGDILAARGPFPVEEVKRLLGPVAAALDYAHGIGVVHRDVKPANVMIRNDGMPFILDFGIAREVKESMTLVTGHSPVGTPLYMPPEQIQGAPPRIEQDIYSFAAMAYECVKGEPPFRRGQVEYQILNVNAEPLDSPLSSGIMKGLAKNPADRPRTCMDVLRLDGMVDGGTTQTVTAPSAIPSPVHAPAPVSMPVQFAHPETVQVPPIVINNTNTIVMPSNSVGRVARCDVLEPEKYDKPIFDDGSRAGRRLVVFLLVIVGALLLLYLCFLRG